MKSSTEGFWNCIRTREPGKGAWKRRSISARHAKVETLGQVTGQRRGFQTRPGEPDVAVRTQEVERGILDPRAAELSIVDWIVGNPVGEYQIVSIGGAVAGRR